VAVWTRLFSYRCQRITVKFPGLTRHVGLEFLCRPILVSPAVTCQNPFRQSHAFLFASRKSSATRDYVSFMLQVANIRSDIEKEAWFVGRKTLDQRTSERTICASTAAICSALRNLSSGLLASQMHYAAMLHRHMCVIDDSNPQASGL